MVKELNLTQTISGVTFKNPVATASGTFMAKESGEFYDIGRLGAVITKGVSSLPWRGNIPPRIAESYGGMLNSIGLQNPGVEHYIKNELAHLREYDVPVITNIAGHSIAEYVDVAERLNETDVAMIEMNISCPNVKEGGIGFGTDAKMAAAVTRAVRAATKKPLMVKLTPNVTDITEIAKAVEGEGADCISLINTLHGMRIDVRQRKAIFANKTGGLSGAAIKPVALALVYRVRRAVKLPIFGLGGIMTGEDAMEFIMAGADMVCVGTAALVNPTAPVDVLDELEALMREQGFSCIDDIHDAFNNSDR